MERAPTTPRRVTGVARSKCFRSVGKRAGGAASEPRAVTNGSSRALRVRPWESAVAMPVGQAPSACAWVWRRHAPAAPASCIVRGGGRVCSRAGSVVGGSQAAGGHRDRRERPGERVQVPALILLRSSAWPASGSTAPGQRWRRRRVSPWACHGHGWDITQWLAPDRSAWRWLRTTRWVPQ